MFDYPMCRAGSIVRAAALSVSEVVPIVGSNLKLVYSSERVNGRLSEFKLKVPLISGTPPSNLTHASYNISIAGQVASATLSASTNLSYTFTWDGKDGSGIDVNTASEATVITSHTFNDSTLDIPLTYKIMLGTYRASRIGLGGWNVDRVHYLDTVRDKLYLGDGSTRSVVKASISGGYRVVSQFAEEVYEFDTGGKHLYTKNGLTGTTLLTFAYNSSGHLTTITDAFSNQTTFNRDGSGNLTGITAPRGQITTISLDSDGYISEIENPNSESYFATYVSADGLLYTFEKPGGEISTMTYDSDGNLTKDESNLNASLTLTSTLNNANRTIGITTAVGRVSNYTSSISGSNNTQQVIDVRPDGSTYSQSFVPGASTSFTHASYAQSEGYSSDIRFGSLASFMSYGTKNPYNNVATSGTQTVTYSSGTGPFNVSDLTETFTTNSKAIQVKYTGSLGETRVQSPLSRKTYFYTDSYGRLTGTKIHNYSPVNYSYDSSGRLEEISQSTRETTLSYDTDGFLSSITNPLSQTTSFTYDLAGRMTRTTLPDSRYIDYTYNPDGLLLSVTPPSKPAHSFLRNLWGSITQFLPPDLSSITTEETTYAYNNDKQVSLITRPDGKTLTFTYNSTTGLLSTLALSGGGGSYSYSYDQGRVSTIQSPDGNRVIATYTAALPLSRVFYKASTGGSFYTISDAINSENYPTTQTLAVSGGTSVGITSGYDNDRLLTSNGSLTISRDSNTGFVTANTVSNIADSFTYDSTYGELSSITSTYTPGPTQLYSASLTRDAVGRITSKAETIGGATTTYDYTFDSAGRLTDVSVGGTSVGSYAYDSNSNRTSGSNSAGSITATYDDQDRLTAYNSLNFTYNDNGELSTKTDTTPTPDDVTTYTYDLTGNLKRVVLPNATQIDYVTDGFNRRVAKKIGGTIQTWYAWSDQYRMIAEITDAGVVTARYIYGTKLVPDYMVKSGTTYKITSDHLGSVRLVVNASTGAVAQRIDYDEYGRVTNDTSPGFQAFGFAGGLYDHQTGLVRFGARDYDAETGRWTSKDPILFNGGDTNLYGYVLNDPINFIDPMGTDANLVTGENLIHTYVEIGQPGSTGTRVELLPATSSYGALATNQPVGGMVSISSTGQPFVRSSSAIPLTPQQDRDLLQRARGMSDDFLMDRRMYQLIPNGRGDNCSSFANDLLKGN